MAVAPPRRLEVFTVAWNCVEAVVAGFAAFAAGSVALWTFGRVRS